MIDPVFFSIFGFQVYWYGISYILGFYLAYHYVLYLASYEADPTLSSLLFWDRCLTGMLLGGVLGGRLGYVLFYDLSYHLSHPLEIFMTWKGGMSFHGGIIGFICAGFWLSRSYRISFLKLADLIAVVSPVGIFLGRIANFINQEHIGRPSSGLFSVVFPRAQDGILRHPSQLYEAFGEGIVLGLILFCFWKKHPKDGGLLASFLIAYSIIRFLLEFFREPDGMVGFLSIGQLLCLPFMGLGMIVFYVKKRFECF